MAVTGKGATSIRKKDLLNQKVPAVGFRKLVFATKLNAGATGIDLTALSTPSEMSGFVNPNASEVAAANLQFFRKNLTLYSTARGPLLDYLSYTVNGNTSIQFTDSFGTALQNEIFVGVVDPVARTGMIGADVDFILESGSLAATTTDIALGKSIQTNYNPSRQAGEVVLWIDGVQQFRNAGNATAAPSADGNYEEVDNGAGQSTLLRLNIADPSDARAYLVMSTFGRVVRPDGSVLDVIEQQQGTLDTVISTVAALAGVPTTNFQATPTQPQLKQFGDRVLTLEQNRARIDATNTFTATQLIPGRTNGTPVPTGYVGETITSGQITNTVLGTSNTDVTGASIALTAGIWSIYYSVDVEVLTTAVSGERTIGNIEITDAANVTVTGSGSRISVKATSAVIADMNARCTSSVVVNITTSTSYKLRGNRIDLVSGPGTATALLGNGSAFYAVRIG